MQTSGGVSPSLTSRQVSPCLLMVSGFPEKPAKLFKASPTLINWFLTTLTAKQLCIGTLKGTAKFHAKPIFLYSVRCASYQKQSRHFAFSISSIFLHNLDIHYGLTCKKTFTIGKRRRLCFWIICYENRDSIVKHSLRITGTSFRSACFISEVLNTFLLHFEFGCKLREEFCSVKLQYSHYFTCSNYTFLQFFLNMSVV